MNLRTLMTLLVAVIAAVTGWAIVPDGGGESGHSDVTTSAPSSTENNPSSKTATNNANTVRTGRFDFCRKGAGKNCVVDGDTFSMGGDRIRIADIDTPELNPPRCAEEERLGQLARLRLHELLNSGTVKLHPYERDEDRYGRKLRTVSVNGRNVGDTLIAEGLARPYNGGRRPWCEN